MHLRQRLRWDPGADADQLIFRGEPRTLVGRCTWAASTGVSGHTIGPMDAPAAEALLTLAEDTSAKATGPDGKAALDRLETEYDDLLAALQWFIDHEPTD